MARQLTITAYEMQTVDASSNDGRPGRDIAHCNFIDAPFRECVGIADMRLPDGRITISTGIDDTVIRVDVDKCESGDMCQKRASVSCQGSRCDIWDTLIGDVRCNTEDVSLINILGTCDRM